MQIFIIFTTHLDVLLLLLCKFIDVGKKSRVGMGDQPADELSEN